MRSWKAELDAYAGEISVIANALGIEVPAPATSETASRVVSIRSQKDEIAQHVAKFKAHQQRLIKQREDFAARELTRMRASAFNQKYRGVPGWHQPVTGSSLRIGMVQSL